MEATTTNRIRYVSDSAGRIAIDPRDVGSKSVFFSVFSHGYEIPGNTDEFPGINSVLQPGTEQVVALKRVNIAERLYRETGEGIYHDSQLLEAPTPQPYELRPRGGVFGQDSVINAVYDGKLYWFWGDTRRAESPYGNFAVAGAVSTLDENLWYDASEGVDLTYFVAADGFTKPMCPIPGGGPVWIQALFVVKEDKQEQMLGGYVRVNPSMQPLEIGIARWNPARDQFQKLFEVPLDAPLTLFGHPFIVYDEGETWFYFGHAIPDIRVRATASDLLRPKHYQGYTCLKAGSRWDEENPPLERDRNGALVWAWKTDTDIITPSRWSTMEKNGLVSAAENRLSFVDQETGKTVIPHSGSIAWNEHRKRWVLVFGEIWGKNSFLGEVWYAEALDPEGPWSPARKIVTHDRYSFYNVKQHPYFANGKYIYFEGTYTQSFSGNDQATPRYDYNQIMYRLDVDDPRLPRMADTKPQQPRSEP